MNWSNDKPELQRLLRAGLCALAACVFMFPAVAFSDSDDARQVAQVSGFPDGPPMPGAEAEPSSAQDRDELMVLGILAREEGDFERALEIFSLLAGKGDAEAMFHLGRMHEKGQGVARNELKARELYRRAAEKGYAKAGQAARELGGTATAPRDHSQRTPAASIPGDSAQRYRAALDARRRNDYEKARAILRSLSDEGYQPAWRSLASLIYQEGRGDKADYAEAFYLYKKGSEAGDAQAQMMLAGMHRRGHGTAKDLDKAIMWYRRADDGGNPYAPHHLGVMYEKGVGVPVDLDKARELYKRSGDRGYSWGAKAYGRLSK